MVKKTIVKAGLYLKECLEARGVSVSKIILFGSQATAHARKLSDAYFIIVSEDFRGKDIFARADLIGDVEYLVVKKFTIPMDLLLKTPEEIEKGASVTAHYVKTQSIVVWAA